MPCTPEMLNKAAICSSQFRLISFTATPNNVTPGQAVTLRWNIDRSGECNANFKINGVTVPMDGTKVVNPLTDTTYRISVNTGCGITRNLGAVFVNVNDSSCRTTFIAEGLVRQQIIQAVDRNIQEYNQTSSNDLSKRSETQVEIDSTGIIIRLRLKAAINNFPDPDLNVDMKIGVGVGPGNTVSVFYRSFSIDVDWPWWVTGISLGITKIVEEIVEGRIEGKIKSSILDGLRAQINTATQLIPGVLAGIQTSQDAIQLKIC
jgi:hypothetical protein